MFYFVLRRSTGCIENTFMRISGIASRRRSHHSDDSLRSEEKYDEVTARARRVVVTDCDTIVEMFFFVNVESLEDQTDTHRIPDIVVRANRNMINDKCRGSYHRAVVVNAYHRSTNPTMASLKDRNCQLQVGMILC